MAYRRDTAYEAELSLIVDGIAGRAVGALDERSALVEGLESAAVQTERVALVVVNRVLVAPLLLALLQHFLRLRAGVRILLAVHVGQLQKTAGERRGVNKVLQKERNRCGVIICELHPKGKLILGYKI